MMKKLLIAAMLAGSLGSVTIPATSAVVVIRQAPPEPRSERAPPPRRGYVWAPGYWDWKYNKHVWVRGKWIHDRKGHVYNTPRWEERDNRWHMSRGNWARGDRDGDGVRNRDDARPNNPNRN